MNTKVLGVFTGVGVLILSSCGGGAEVVSGDALKSVTFPSSITVKLPTPKAQSSGIISSILSLGQAASSSFKYQLQVIIFDPVKGITFGVIDLPEGAAKVEKGDGQDIISYNREDLLKKYQGIGVVVVDSSGKSLVLSIAAESNSNEKKVDFNNKKQIAAAYLESEKAKMLIGASGGQLAGTVLSKLDAGNAASVLGLLVGRLKEILVFDEQEYASLQNFDGEKADDFEDPFVFIGGYFSMVSRQELFDGVSKDTQELAPNFDDLINNLQTDMGEQLVIPDMDTLFIAMDAEAAEVSALAFLGLLETYFDEAKTLFEDYRDELPQEYLDVMNTLANTFDFNQELREDQKEFLDTSKPWEGHDLGAFGDTGVGSTKLCSATDLTGEEEKAVLDWLDLGDSSQIDVRTGASGFELYGADGEIL